MRILYKISLLNESKAFFKSINGWCTASMYSGFFSSIFDERIIYDQQSHCCVEIHTDDPQ